jgi:hypothetical protein
MTGHMRQRVDLVATRYDTPTKIWTYFLGIMIAAIVDWFALYVPVNDHPPETVHSPGWFAAMFIVIVAPASWLVGRIANRDGDGIVMWSAALGLVVVAQLVVLAWATS